MRRFSLICWVPLLVLTACANVPAKRLAGAEAAAEPAVEQHITFWYEDADLTLLRDNLSICRQYNLRVNIALHRGQTEFAAVAELLQAAGQYQVPIALWPLLEMDYGYFPNVRNIDEFLLWWNEIVGVVLAERLPIYAMVFDLEPSLDVLFDLGDLFSAGTPEQAIAFLYDRYDARVFEEGRTKFAGLIERAHDDGLRIEASTLFMAVDDFADGDDTIQRALDIPLENMGFDKISFQVYRSGFADFIGGWLLEAGQMPSAWAVYDYGLSAGERFGEVAALDLGVIGGGAYLSPDDLAADIAAARAAGFGNDALNIYALHTLLLRDDYEQWLQALAAPEMKPEKDAAIATLRSLIATLDLGVDL